MKIYRNLVRLLTAVCLLGWSVNSGAGSLFSFGDAEKPRPEFRQNGQEIIAKFVPRAKSTSVVITFRVSAGGTLEDVRGIDFETVQRPEVDVKNFKSAVFQIRIVNAAVGGTAIATLQSDFFTQSTAFYVYNPNRDRMWNDAKVENRSLTGRVRELVIAVRDGGDFDADGARDGRISIIGGPRDSFWGYALGTLFIRFFGIFIVLSILMIGMILSGVAFKAVDRLKARKGKNRKSSDEPGAAGTDAAASVEVRTAGTADDAEETAAAIGVALHLYSFAGRRSSDRPVSAGPENNWAAEGRRRMMNDRLTVFNRFNR